MIKRYRKKPIVVEMVEWTGNNREEVKAFAGAGFRVVDGVGQVFDELHKSWGDIEPGDSIVKGTEGEFYPIKARVLADTYEEVTD